MIDGTRIAVGMSTGIIHVLDSRMGLSMAQFRAGSDGAVHQLAFLSNDTIASMSGTSRFLDVWDISESYPLTPFLSTAGGSCFET